MIIVTEIAFFATVAAAAEACSAAAADAPTFTMLGFTLGVICTCLQQQTTAASNSTHRQLVAVATVATYGTFYC